MRYLCPVFALIAFASSVGYCFAAGGHWWIALSQAVLLGLTLVFIRLPRFAD